MGVAIAAAIAASAAVGAGASIYAAKSASDSAAAANETNLKNTADTNAANYRMFLQSRGSDGNALLPMYFGPNGESTLGNRAMQTYLAEQASLGSPEAQIAANQAVVKGLQPAMTAGDTLVNQLFSDDLEKQQEANIAPVLAARGDVAKAQKTGILEGLSARLNALSADRARSGYTGGGSAYQKNLLVGATIPALQGAATVGAQADLANATDLGNIKNAAIATKLGNLSLPLTQAGNRIQLNGLPAAAASRSFTDSVQPLDWFKLQPQAFANQRPPLVSPVPNMGQIVGSAISSGASTLGNYFAQRQLAQQLSPTSPAASSGGMPNTSYTSPTFNQGDAMAIDYYGAGG